MALLMEGHLYTETNQLVQTRGKFMKRIVCSLLLISAVCISGVALAQDANAFKSTVNSTSNSSVNTGASSSAANEGNAQNITFNSAPAPTHTHETVRAAPSMAMGSFGTSFSSDNCSNTVAGQMSVIGVGASFGKAVIEQNCAHIRRGYAFGQMASFAIDHHQMELATKMEAMVDFEFCTADGKDSDTAKACEAMGLIQRGKVALPVAAVVNQRDNDVSQVQQSAIRAQDGINYPAGTKLYSPEHGYYTIGGSRGTN